MCPFFAAIRLLTFSFFLLFALSRFFPSLFSRKQKISEFESAVPEDTRKEEDLNSESANSDQDTNNESDNDTDNTDFHVEVTAPSLMERMFRKVEFLLY